jgi:hypothetical protein
MSRFINIFYRHVHSRAEERSRDPHKKRPEWFTFEACFRNLLATVNADPLGNHVNITVMFDGTQADYLDDFMVKYQAVPDNKIELQFLSAGSDKNSALLTLWYINNANLPSGHLIYVLENDYVHHPNWVTKVIELYESEVKVDYLSLYDHRDKYFLNMYSDLKSSLYHTRSHHWRTSPSSCGSYIVDADRFRSDYDILQLGLPDYYFFKELVEGRSRVLLTPIPGLSTHCMEGYMSPTVEWRTFLV